MDINAGRELGWDDEVEGKSPVIPAGEYNFTVESFERGRFPGSDKMPECPQATLKLNVETPEGRMTTYCNLFLHTRMQWRLFQFFTSIGQRSHGDKLTMNWSMVPGAAGRCKIKIRKYKDKNGDEREANDIDFLDPKSTAAQSKKTWKPGAF